MGGAKAVNPASFLTLSIWGREGGGGGSSQQSKPNAFPPLLVYQLSAARSALPLNIQVQRIKPFQGVGKNVRKSLKLVFFSFFITSSGSAHPPYLPHREQKDLETGNREVAIFFTAQLEGGGGGEGGFVLFIKESLCSIYLIYQSRACVCSEA